MALLGPDPESNGSLKPTLIIVDDEFENCELIERVLGRDFRTLKAEDGAEGLQLLSTHPVSVIIADMRMPRMNGAQFLKEAARIQPLARRLILTAYADADSIVNAINEGQIHHFVQKPFNAAGLRSVVMQLRKGYDLEVENARLVDELKETNLKLREKETWLSGSLDQRERELFSAVEELRLKNAALEQLALRDGLTGLYNHRSFQERLREELARAQRLGSSVSLLLCDVDHFKRLNDTLGHPAGDAVLKRVAQILAGEESLGPASRKSDVVARYGGEEFAIILPDTSKDGASVRAERLRQAFPNAHLDELAPTAEQLSVSFGVAGYPEDASTAEDLVACADMALLRAKQEGRNRVIIWAREPTGRPGIVSRFREVQGELGSKLREERVLCLVNLALPDLYRIENNFGRSFATRVSEVFRNSVLDTAYDIFAAGDVLAAVSSRPESLELFIGAQNLGDRTGPRYLDQIAEVVASRVEVRMRTELGYHVGLLRVVGSHARKLFARSVPIEYQLQELTEEGQAQARAALDRRRCKDKLEVQRLILERRIRSYVQPIYGEGGRTVIGYEALARGPADSPFESPVVMLDMADDSALLPELDFCMAESALALAPRIPSNALLFLNVLGSTLADKTFLRTELPKMLATAGLSHGRLILELSERQSLDHSGQFAEAREAVKSAGFALCLDDVGTKNANLAEIAAFQPEWLKLDRSLVSGVDVQKVKKDLIHAIVDFGSRQNSKIVAEGIENQQELDLLKSLNVAYFQGFLLGRPKPLPEI